jgi:hypothetical protein
MLKYVQSFCSKHLKGRNYFEDLFIDGRVLVLSMGWGCVSELQLLTGLLSITQTMYKYGEPRWNDIDRGSRGIRRKTRPSATLSTTDLTWTGPGEIPGLRGERPATNRLSHTTTTRWKNNIKMDPVKRGCGLDTLGLGKGSVQGFVNTVLNICVS